MKNMTDFRKRWKLVWIHAWSLSEEVPKLFTSNLGSALPKMVKFNPGLSKNRQPKLLYSEIQKW